jgi:hypothetical protein
MKLVKSGTVFTKFEPALAQITTPRPGQLDDFIKLLQIKVDEKLDNPPTTETVTNPSAV